MISKRRVPIAYDTATKMRLAAEFTIEDDGTRTVCLVAENATLDQLEPGRYTLVMMGE